MIIIITSTNRMSINILTRTQYQSKTIKKNIFSYISHKYKINISKLIIIKSLFESHVELLIKCNVGLFSDHIFAFI